MRKLKVMEVAERAFSTSRRDPWWLEFVISSIVFGGLIIYSIVRAFQAKYYEFGAYTSPLYPLPLKVGWISPVLLTLWIPAGFRITCYFCRRVYYRSLFADPPACAVKEIKRDYKGESVFPYILVNIHRYFLLLVLLFVPIHWAHALLSFAKWGEGGTFGIGVGLGSLILTIDAVFLTLYVLSCHSLRHFVGGRLDIFSKNTRNYKVWKFVSKLNERHGLFFWLSLVSVGVADFYIYLLASGAISDIVFFRPV